MKDKPEYKPEDQSQVPEDIGKNSREIIHDSTKDVTAVPDPITEIQEYDPTPPPPKDDEQ